MTPARPVACGLWLLLLLACHAATGCRACERDARGRRSAERLPPAEPVEPATSADPSECDVPADCANDAVCILPNCIAGHCVTSFAPAGASCDNDTVCDGVAKCDQAGHCVPGAAPSLDDDNACTLDSCDPSRGVTHQPVPSDDSNPCTTDACDPQTGEVTHVPVDLDDGDDCTIDSCEPERGIRHQPRSPAFTCNMSCEPGYHITSRHPAPECGGPYLLRTVCMPDCGPSYYTCDSSCPNGYRTVSKAPNSQCGTNVSLYLFCQKNPLAEAAGAPSR
jgi:hypothetical protein